MGWICTGCGPRQRSLLCSLDSVRGSFSNQHDSASSAVAGALKNRLLFIYLPLFTQSSLTERARLLFRNALFHQHSVTRIRTSGSQGFPTVVHRAFLLDQPGVNCLARGHFHKSYLGMCWLFFSFTLPSCSQLRDLKKQTSSQKPNSLSYPHGWCRNR